MRSTADATITRIFAALAFTTLFAGLSQTVAAGHFPASAPHVVAGSVSPDNQDWI
ncbi:MULTISPECIES: hypothetical protein [Streptomycetaceae]|uniref:Uncharacterized protein n=1 Tax=Streptantibioticus cattleyicolor (strain ATCC 35852 / DSM 46488 / JCM 4925 / NBRC 14057 / NRRL 8057) TaxID=1003195 RepID=F8K3B6_STREN|nr:MULTISPECIES: hypothetical protein [Streptomycetaceae]AEW95028.1 hypothetical protein SCATT_26570 [Streptantibioticus cattleyicolor NRRL 8057 = DSM 46488]CCB75380.1 exported protein of unknown function [Streptantibioticus cattleyicolor NRRL 8057 = DSM 46488]